MEVDGLNIVLRQRPPWEAADLGMGLVRRHARVLFGSWALATLPVFLALHLALTPFGHAWAAGLLFWWLKPAFERLPLYVLSRGILGQHVGIKEAARQMGWGWSRLWPWLLWRRLHPARSLLLAMDFLEQPGGRARGERARLLARGQASAPGLIWIVGAHLEAMLWISLIAFVLMLVPVEFLDDSLKAMYELMLEDPPPWAEFLQSTAYWLAVLVVEPFYVGAGFALYLNRRTELEAWDIELAFRRLARRVAAAAALVCLGLALLLGPGASYTAMAAEQQGPAARAGAEQPEPGTDDGGEATAESEKSLKELLGSEFRAPDARYQQAVDQVFSDSDLNPKEKVGHWERINPAKPGRRDPPAPWLANLASTMAFLFENALWVLLAILVIWLLLHARRWMADWIGDVPPVAPGQQSPLLDPNSPAPLPDDISGAVRRLWREGQPRAAMSLLYRGAVASLVRGLGQGLPPGATEAEVLRSARRLDDRRHAQWLGEVVGLWQAVAYAHRLPDLALVESLLEQWPHAGVAEPQPSTGARP